MTDLFPKKYQFCHDFALFLHDILAHIVIQGEKDNIFDVDFELPSKTDAENFETLKLSGESLWNWLDNNNYMWVTKQIAINHCFVALLSDLCEYAYESLICSGRGNLSIAYSLLRKPFKDNLFYLEWLLVDPINFHDSFKLLNPDEFSLNSIPKERKLFIITNAIGSLTHKDWLSPEFIYDLRYNKKINYGLEPIWNQATHLITNCESYKTEPGNFNFIFSDEDSILSQWEYYYRIIPFMLFYAVEIINKLLLNFTKKKYESLFDEFRRQVGFFLYSYETMYKPNSKNALKCARDIIGLLDLTCPLCKRKISLAKKNLKTFFYNSGLICSVCGTEIYINLKTKEVEDQPTTSLSTI